MSSARQSEFCRAQLASLSRVLYAGRRKRRNHVSGECRIFGNEKQTDCSVTRRSRNHSPGFRMRHDYDHLYDNHHRPHEELDVRPVGVQRF